MTDEQETPTDPITVLMAASVQLHEQYLGYVKAGFTEAQALYLVGQIIRGLLGAQPPA